MQRKNDVLSKCKTKLTGLVLPGIMSVDTVIPEINTNMRYDYRDKFAYFRQALICGIIQQESKGICKPGSGTLLRKKNLDDFLSFSWEALNKELSVTCPNLINIIS